MPDQRPNLIYLNPDEWRGDCLSCYGDPVVGTPNVDRLAAGGARFADCFVQHTVCTPSRCSFMTGWYPHVRGHRTLWHPLQAHEPNTLRYLKAAGYQVHWWGKNDLLAPDAYADSVDAIHRVEGDYRAADLFAPGEPGFMSFLRGPATGAPPEAAMAAEAADWLRAWREGDAPFMHFHAWTWPHCPYTVPEPWYSRYDPADLPLLRPAELSDKPDFHRLIRRYRGLDGTGSDGDLLRKLRAVYLGMIAYVDHQLGVILDALDETGLAERTAVFFFTDHGDWAGDYGLVEKWPSGLDDCLTRTALVVRAPGCTAGHVVDGITELIDIVPTTLDLAGVELGHTQFGRSLVPQLLGAAGDPERYAFTEGGYDPHEPHCFEGKPSDGVCGDPRSPYYPKGRQQQEESASVGRCVAIRGRDRKLVRRPGGVSELYDLERDPREQRNLYCDPAYAAERADLERRLLDWLIRTSDVTPWETDPRGHPG